MKRLFLFLVPFLMFACTNKEPNNKAIICGKITDPSSDYFIVTLNEKSDTAKILEDGTFYMKIDIEEPHYGTIRSGEYSNIFLSPGDSIFVELDTKEFDETITYSGIGAEISNYLAKKLLVESEFTSSPSELLLMQKKTPGKKQS